MIVIELDPNYKVDLSKALHKYIEGKIHSIFI